MRIDNLKRAKEILDQLIDEKHPYTKEVLPITDVVCDERVHQWLCFVDEEISNLISKCETEKSKRIKRRYETFTLTEDEAKAKFNYLSKPMSVCHIANELNSLADCETQDEITPFQLNHWLKQEKMLTYVDTPYGRMVKPTQLGEKIGILWEEKEFMGKKYISIKYTEEAQRFICTHLNDFLAFRGDI